MLKGFRKLVFIRKLLLYEIVINNGRLFLFKSKTELSIRIVDFFFRSENKTDWQACFNHS